MRNIFFVIMLVCFSLLHFAEPVEALTQKKIMLQDFKEIFSGIMKENIPSHIKDFRVTDFSCEPEAVAIPEGKLSYRLLNPVLCATPGKKFVSVVLLVDGNECDRIKMYGNIQFWGTVVLASHSIARRTPLSAEDIETDFRDISMLGDNQINLPEKAIGKQLTKSLRAGDIIFSYLLKSPPVVSRGDLVTIIARSGGLQVSAPGEVKNAGAIGEIVRVKNLNSRRVLQARVVDSSLVEVDL